MPSQSKRYASKSPAGISRFMRVRGAGYGWQKSGPASSAADVLPASGALQNEVMLKEPENAPAYRT